MIFSDFLRSIAQFDDPRFRRVLWRGLGLTIVLLAAACLLVIYGVNQLLSSALVAGVIGDQSWLGSLFNIGGVLFTIALSIWLMVPVASAIIALFLDEVAQAVEARHYPHLPKQAAAKLQDQILGQHPVFRTFDSCQYWRFDPLNDFAIFGACRVLGHQRLSDGPGIFSNGRYAARAARASPRAIAAPSGRYLVRWDLDGYSLDYSAGGIVYPYSRRGHLHPSVRETSGVAIRLNQSMSRTEITPLIIVPATTAQITKATTVVTIKRFFICGFSGLPAWVPGSIFPTSP